MPGTTTSAFSEPDDFAAALGQQCRINVLVTGRGPFRARLTQVALSNMSLSACEEHLPRIAFITVPANKLLITFSLGDQSSPRWGGLRFRPGEIMTVGPGQSVHAWTDGPIRAGMLFLPVRQLTACGRALIGRSFAIPPGIRICQPSLAMIRHLRNLHAGAIRASKAHPQLLIDTTAAHGLEQQLFHAVVECMSTDRLSKGNLDSFDDVVVRFDSFLQRNLRWPPRLYHVCSRLGIPAGLLYARCKRHMGISPGRYVRLRRMQLVYRGLRTASPDTGTVAEVARRYGFNDLSRFAAIYRSIFGELPSVTLQRP